MAWPSPRLFRWVQPCLSQVEELCVYRCCLIMEAEMKKGVHKESRADPFLTHASGDLSDVTTDRNKMVENADRSEV